MPPIFPSSKEYMASLTAAKRANNSSLSNVLTSLGVRCTPCMESHIRNLKSPKAREDYMRLLRLSPENIKLVQETFETQK